MEGDSRERRRLGVVFLNYGFSGLLGLTSCEGGELENVEWTVASVFSVLDKCCRPKLTIYYPFSPGPPPPKFICSWEVMKSSSSPCCDSKSHSSRHIQRDPYSNLPHQHDNKGFVAETACWQNFFFNIVLPNTFFDIKPCGFCGCVSLGWWSQIQKHLVTRLYKTVVVLNNSFIDSQQEVREAKCSKNTRMQTNLVPNRSAFSARPTCLAPNSKLFPFLS